jgi:hypothetical protein
MQHHRNDGLPVVSARRAIAPPPVDRVCGLGLCDALRIELEPCQVDSLHAEIDELRRGLDEAICVSIGRGAGRGTDSLSYEHQVLDMIRTQVVRLHESSGRVVVSGPAVVLTEIVAGAARDAADELAEIVRRHPRGDSHTGAALLEAARVASAWAATYAALQAVESYSFDPDCDPVRP